MFSNTTQRDWAARVNCTKGSWGFCVQPVVGQGRVRVMLECSEHVERSRRLHIYRTVSLYLYVVVSRYVH